VQGRGYKIVNYLNMSYLRLGYGHLHFLFFIPDMFIKKKLKKKMFYKYFSSFFFPMSTILSRIHRLRFPDYYTRKGIYYQKKLL